MKEKGVLLPIFSLPSKYGIGDFGDEAYEFIDILTSVANLIQDSELAQLIRDSNIGDEVNIINKIEYILKNNI